MNRPRPPRQYARLLLAAATPLLTIAIPAVTALPAQAQFRASFGVPCCGYWGYYGYSAPYYPPPPGYYPPPGPYAPPTAASPSAYSPAAPPASAPAAPAGPGADAARGTPAITYTNKPAFINAAGQTCREYKTTDTTSGHPVDVFGTACRAADGQWRVAN